MKNLVSVVALLSVLAGAAQATEVGKQAVLPKGVVTVEMIPTVVVEAKRWSAADEAALQKTQANAAAQSGEQLSKSSRGPEYAMH
jgi:hypothetical protein